MSRSQKSIKFLFYRNGHSVKFGSARHIRSLTAKFYKDWSRNKYVLICYPDIQSAIKIGIKFNNLIIFPHFLKYIPYPLAIMLS